MELIYGILKFLGILPIDILLDSVIFTPIRLVNAYAASWIKGLFYQGKLIESDHDHDYVIEGHEDHDAAEHHHVHKHGTEDQGYIDKTTTYIAHHGEYVLPALGVIALDYATEATKGGLWLDAVGEIPGIREVTQELHNFMEPGFGVPALDGALEVYEAIHVAVHMVEAFSPYYSILMLDRSLEEELADIDADFICDMEMATLPVVALFSTIQEGTGWIASQYDYQG
ncbi:MAG: hypothetical protein JSS50_05535 [Proteobacteria bacterium]|nr:hypothetical protein [Pseudomonadota bacterium]